MKNQLNDRDMYAGALEEMKFWVRIIFEHLKFHRNGVDPGNERAFRIIDDYEVATESFYDQCIFPAPLTASREELLDLISNTLKVIVPVRDFKIYLTNEINRCNILSLIDPALADHLRRETDYHIGQLNYALGEPTPTRETIGIPGGSGSGRALTAPRRAIPDLSREEFFKYAIENIMFFSRIHGEHAHHITLITRPEIQEDIRQRARQFEALLFANIEAARRVEAARTGFEDLINNTYSVALAFGEFGAFINDALHTCSVPTGRVNAWPLLADHITREGLYFIDILSRLINGEPVPPPDTPIYPYIR